MQSSLFLEWCNAAIVSPKFLYEESLLLWLMFLVWVSDLNNILNMPPVGLCLCLLKPGLGFSVMSNVFSCSSLVVSLEEYVLFSSETFDFLSYPWLLWFISSEHFGRDELFHKWDCCFLEGVPKIFWVFWFCLLLKFVYGRSELFLHSFVVCLFVLENLSWGYLHFYGAKAGLDEDCFVVWDVWNSLNLVDESGITCKEEFQCICCCFSDPSGFCYHLVQVKVFRQG